MRSRTRVEAARALYCVESAPTMYDFSARRSSFFIDVDAMGIIFDEMSEMWCEKRERGGSKTSSRSLSPGDVALHFHMLK